MSGYRLLTGGVERLGLWLSFLSPLGIGSWWYVIRDGVNGLGFRDDGLASDLGYLGICLAWKVAPMLRLFGKVDDDEIRYYRVAENAAQRFPFDRNPSCQIKT